MEAYMESICQISLCGSFCVGIAWSTGVSLWASLFSDCGAVSDLVVGLFHSRNQTHERSTPRGWVAFSSWPIKSKREWWLISSFYSFFETVLGKEHTGKVFKKLLGNFYFLGITLGDGLCLSCDYRVMDSRGKLGEHERSGRVARGDSRVQL